VKREVRLLLKKAVNSLILSVDHFNRTWDTGRVEATLIMLDHSFEMLLKAAILHRGGQIREPYAKETYEIHTATKEHNQTQKASA